MRSPYGKRLRLALSSLAQPARRRPGSSSRLGGGIGTRGPGETQARNRPPPHRPAHQEDRGRTGGRARRPRAAPPPPERRSAGHAGAGGLHQRRQIHPLQPPHRGRRAGGRAHVRHARSHRAPAGAALAPARAAQRHRGLHPQPAHHPGEGVSRHAGGSDGGRHGAARGGRLLRFGGRLRGARHKVLAEIGAAGDPADPGDE